MVNYIICMRFNGATTQMNTYRRQWEERIKACETNTFYTRRKWNGEICQRTKWAKLGIFETSNIQSRCYSVIQTSMFPSCRQYFVSFSFFRGLFFFFYRRRLEISCQPKACSYILNRKKQFLWLNSRTIHTFPAIECSHFTNKETDQFQSVSFSFFFLYEKCKRL